MAAQTESTRTRIENIKTDLRATTSCTDTTAATLRDLLSRRNEDAVQKENVGVKVPGALRRKADAAKAAASQNAPKPEPTVLAPREKYILATEVANLSLKALADALKNQPSTPAPRSSPKSAPAENPTRKATRPPTATQQALKERSGSQTTNSAKRTPTSTRPTSVAASTSGPDLGLVATAECARMAFAYLGTAEAKKVVGKDGTELQVENGVLALIGKLVALGLDNLAVKEIRLLKRRLEAFLGHTEGRNHGANAKKTAAQHDVGAEKEGLASLLHFGTIESTSPALPIVANLQTYTLRVIARLKKAATIEACWDYLQLSNKSSPANLLQQLADTSTGAAKAARQLESLAQTILALCPSISALDDAAPLQPSPEAVLRLQHLAFTIRKKWWDLAKHKSNEDRELVEPFTKCVIAYARRSKQVPTEKYNMSKTLSAELLAKQSLTPGSSGCSLLITKTLCNLAQAAGLSEEALQWLGGPEAGTAATGSAAKQACRLLRIATVSLEAANKGEDRPGLDEAISTALKALQGSLGGSSTDLDSLFMEANALRRAGTRSLAAGLSASSLSSEDLAIQARAISMIAASVHFSARFIGRRSMAESEPNPQQQHKDRINMAWKCTKSIVESVLTCCKRSTSSPELWSELDIILQDCCYILRRLGEEIESGEITDPLAGDVVSSCLVKLSNSYWNTYLQLRKASAIDPELLLVAMRRSIDLVSEGSETQQEAGHLAMKLERLGENLDNLQKPEESRKAFGQCIGYHIYLNDQALAHSCAQQSLHDIFESDGKFNTLGRLLKALHRSYLLHGVKRASELAYHDDTYLQPDIRGAVLEWQLTLYSKTLSRNRQWDSSLNHSIKTLTDCLLDIYSLERYPVRRLRFISLLLQLSQDHPHIVSHDLLPSDTSPDNLATVDFSEDGGLSKLKEHLGALCSFKLAMQQASPPAETLRQCFATWEFLAKSASDWTALTQRIGDMESWIHDIQACVDYLNAKGEEYLALPVLHLLVTIFELQNGNDASDLVCSLSALTLQFLRLGYTGKAGLSLAKAEILVSRQTASTEAKLKWHTAHAEYLVRIGDTDKCASILATAESIACSDVAFMDLSTSSATISQRLRYNSVLANACYVYSLLAASNGAHKEAARYAKQSVTLNRRMWAALESKTNAQKALAESDATILDGPSKLGTDLLASMRDDKGTPIVSSNTHDVLGGADFWFMVPSLYRALMQHSHVLANQGLLQEAMYVAEQAGKVASATRSPSMLTDNASWQAACWAQSGRPDKAAPLLEALDQTSDRKSLSVAAYHSAIARVHHCTGDFEQEIASYGILEQLLDDLTSPAYIRSLGAIHPDLDFLASQIAGMSLDATKAKSTRAPVSTKVQKPAAKPPSRSNSRAGARSATGTRSRVGAASAASTTSTSKTAPKGRPKSMIAAPSSETISTSDQATTLRALQADVFHRGALANLLQEDMTAAMALIEKVQELQVGADRDVQHIWVKFKLMLAESAQQIAADFAFNTLPESTIAFPAIGTKDRRMSEGVHMKKTTPIGHTKGKGGRTKKAAAVTKVDFTDTLRQAREHLLEVHALSATHGSNHLFQQVSNALGHITVLLSAVSEARGSVHPLYAAYTSEIPKCNAMRLAQEFVESEKEQLSREESLTWPLLAGADFGLTSASDFQQEYIDIIPESWNAISLGLNEARDELYVTRFEAGVAPFVLRLPLARHASRDLDEDEFTFQDGKRDFEEIIELSDFSTRGAKDMTSREERQQWWDEREALDTRLHELLVNMENIWLGGFKGVFSQHPRQPTLLAKFRKAFEDVLNRNLPSRSMKTQPKRPVLDARVLELFIGLGDLTNEELDLDEALTDLIYFIVDILQFNGEANAYDEIDFDAMVVETQDALKAYYSAARSSSSHAPHTILMLDNSLHGFPWESMPCLSRLSISRLPSLAALRQRLLSLRPSSTEDAAPGHYIASSSGGTTILNPGGDLANTSKTLGPVINALQGDWTHISSRPPTEAEFSTALGTRDLLLYFGHGSGAQFVRQKSVRKLYPGKQEFDAVKPGCATSFLFGCSSVHLTENGIYEPSGMLQSYLTAGAPAVVGMLWDVTDKDCDRFAVRAGELWGLWPEADEEAQPSKTPKKSAKGKAKAKAKAKLEVTGGERKGEYRRGVGLDEAVRDARQACYLKYLNGAAAVVYGIPCYLE